MTLKDFSEISASTAIIFLAVFQVVRLEVTLRRLTNVLTQICSAVGVKTQ